MKLYSLLFTSVYCIPAKYDSENFVTSNEVSWVLSMDSVMGGGSLGTLDQYDDHIHFSGQLDLINGGFAGFIGPIGSKLTGYEGKKDLV